MKVEYSSNNSGGDWWLDDEDWFALERAGWEVDWVKNGDRLFVEPGGDRFLGALAMNATREGLSLDEAIAEWEQITGQYAYAQGCDCCGRPHEFWED